MLLSVFMEKTMKYQYYGVLIFVRFSINISASQKANDRGNVNANNDADDY
jgi:hypothetical protein